MKYTTYRFRSTALKNERDIFVHIPTSGRCSTLLVFLDAELYRDRVEAPQVIESLVDRGEIEEPAVAFVSYCTRDARWIECECHQPFTVFIVDELLPWLVQQFPVLEGVGNRALIGLSYTGLAASWVGLERPKAFRKIVSQSGSYWWNDCWLCRRYELKRGSFFPSFYLDVGTKETNENVRHKEDLVQVISQIAAVREFRDALKIAGVAVKYHEFDGGHDSVCWREMLPMALTWTIPNQQSLDPTSSSVTPPAGQESRRP